MSDEPNTRTNSASGPVELAPADYCDPVIEAYKKDVDRTLLRENLKLTPEERLRKADCVHVSVAGWREAGKRLHTSAGRREQT
jgi:hypothetical protein